MSLCSDQFPINPLSWTKALLLSPGMLFLFGYLGLYGTMAMHMNGAFKNELQQRYTLYGEKNHTVTIGSIRPDFDMQGITLNRIELLPTENCPEKHRRHRTMTKLVLDFPEPEKNLFSHHRFRESTKLVCRKIREVEETVQ